MTPDPKKKRIDLKGKAYTAFRKQVADRAGEWCEEPGCKNYAPRLYSGKFHPIRCGHVAHIRHGVHGDDVMENVKWKCSDCHAKEHSWKSGIPDV